jgi:hypothetical protein
MVNYANQLNASGMDEVVNNSRVRANTSGTNAQGVMWMQGTGVVTSIASGSSTYTAAQLGGGLIVHKNAGAVNGTLDTATAILNYMNANSAGVNIGDILQVFVMNTGSGALTIVPDASGALDGNGSGVIPANTSKTLNIKITAISTPAYIVYL